MDGSMVYTNAREREVHRFYQPWLETFCKSPLDSPRNTPGWHEDHHIPRSSDDKALSAFAQLGCLKLRAKRGVVTLIDGSLQYVLAEATKSLSLMDDDWHAEGDEMWAGNSVLPRQQGLSEEALEAALYTVVGDNGVQHSAPALIISDITKHEDYKKLPYAGKGVNFFGGVPIITKAGHTIGIYAITDDKPRDALTVDEFRFMTDIATVVAQHLEVTRNDRARARGAKLIRGIGRFMEGNIDGSIAGSDGVFSAADSSNTELEIDKQQKPFANGQNGLKGKLPPVKPWRGLVISQAEAYGANFTRNLSPSKVEIQRPELPEDLNGTRNPHTDPNEVTKKGRSLQKGVGSPGNNQTDVPGSIRKDKAFSTYYDVFERATKILRDCMSSDGVVFLDASSANLSHGASRRNWTTSSGTTIEQVKRNRSIVSSNGGSIAATAVKTFVEDENESTLASSDSECTTDESPSIEGLPDSNESYDPQLCEVLALDLRPEMEETQINISEKELRRLVRHYPRGKHYSFAKPIFPTSAVSPEAGYVRNEQVFRSSKNQNNYFRHRRKGSLLRALPDARNIVFLPLWDLARQRWNSVLIIWSSNPAVLANIQDDLAYLKAFANSVMNEIVRLDLALSEKAKTRFLANISHELRSPLHGILGSIEFLHDTAMDDFQSSLVTSVETCGKTLLDTVNHVLDYSKIRNFSKSEPNRPIDAIQGRNFDASGNSGSLVEDFDLAVVVEEAVEAVYAGQVFRTTNSDQVAIAKAGARSLSSSSSSDPGRNDHQIKSNVTKSSTLTRTPILLTLSIEFEDNWNVTSQPGALRRIVMNLLGNALKYTEKGSIDVSLIVDKNRKRNKHIHTCLTVIDTGKGMSDDFVRNHAFTAFSQEDSLASGTGLGLSIVRQIVDSLGGKIDLRSQKDIGTEIKIWLSLPLASTNSKRASQDNWTTMSRAYLEARDKSVCLLNPELKTARRNESPPHLAPIPTLQESVERLLSHWFGVKAFSSSTWEGIDTNFFMYAEPPPIEHLLEQHSNRNGLEETPIIILCTNAFEASRLRASGLHSLTELGRIIEVISQPCGPQKLAKVLHRCQQRLKALEQSNGQDLTQPASVSERINDGLSQPRPISEESKSETDYGKNPEDDSRNSSQQFPVDAFKPVVYERGEPESRDTTEVSPEIPHSPGLIVENPTRTELPRVLVVDDNSINLQLLVTFVRKANRPHSTAVNGLEALELYKKSSLEEDPSSRFKYILMDISMPIMDGMRSCREIRAFEQEHLIRPAATIIALTGLGSDNAQQDAYNAGFDQFLSKPVKFKELLTMLG